MNVFGEVEFSGLGLRSDRTMFNFGGTQHASSKFHPQTERVRAEMVERQWGVFLAAEIAVSRFQFLVLQ